MDTIYIMCIISRLLVFTCLLVWMHLRKNVRTAILGITYTVYHLRIEKKITPLR